MFAGSACEKWPVARRPVLRAVGVQGSSRNPVFQRLQTHPRKCFQPSRSPEVVVAGAIGVVETWQRLIDIFHVRIFEETLCAPHKKFLEWARQRVSKTKDVD